MTIYAVGDIQGCFSHLKLLLDRVGFDPARDQLWSVGDIVNRGPQSLETLRYCRNLGTSFRMVLGNHDLHLLAVARGQSRHSRKDTLDSVLAAADLPELVQWLESQPLLISDAGYTMAHAGIPPQWTIDRAEALATEVSEVLRSDPLRVYSCMYGNQPDIWSDDLAGGARLRTIINYFTRMRFCDRSGRLELNHKLGPDHPPRGFLPWYAHPQREARRDRIIFGHWAALKGQDCGPNLFPLDTGCVWGGPLRLMNLETGKYFHSR